MFLQHGISLSILFSVLAFASFDKLEPSIDAGRATDTRVLHLQKGLHEEWELCGPLGCTETTELCGTFGCIAAKYVTSPWVVEDDIKKIPSFLGNDAQKPIAAQRKAALHNLDQGGVLVDPHKCCCPPEGCKKEAVMADSLGTQTANTSSAAIDTAKPAVMLNEDSDLESQGMPSGAGSNGGISPPEQSPVVPLPPAAKSATKPNATDSGDEALKLCGTWGCIHANALMEHIAPLAQKILAPLGQKSEL